MGMEGQDRKVTLLLLGHGSSKHPGSSRSVRQHAEILRQRGCFSEVRIAFLKEEPFIQDALDDLETERLAIVPDFLAEGYFTKQVIPELLGIEQLPESSHYHDPVGTHPMMQVLIYQAAQAVLGDWAGEDVSLLVVGHGSRKNTQSKKSLLDHIDKLQKSEDFSQVSDLWLEESPFVRDWRARVWHKRVIVVPFLLSDGQHGGWDIPEMLGLEQGVGSHGVTHLIDGQQIRLTPALGVSPRFADVISALASDDLASR